MARTGFLKKQKQKPNLGKLRGCQSSTFGICCDPEPAKRCRASFSAARQGASCQLSEQSSGRMWYRDREKRDNEFPSDSLTLATACLLIFVYFSLSNDKVMPALYGKNTSEL